MPTRRTHRRAAVLSAAAVLALTAGCGIDKAAEPFRDAPVAGHDDRPADIINLPDGFSNVATKCDGPNRLYVAYHGDSGYAAVAVVAGDPRCTKAAQ